MKDTLPRMDKKFRDMLLARSGEERLKMGCSMHAAARALVLAALPEKDAVRVSEALFLRFYGDEFEPKRRKRILRALREAARNREKNEPARVVKEMRVVESSGRYRVKDGARKRK